MKQFKQITSPLPPILLSPLNPLSTKQKFFRNSLFHSPILGKYLKKKSIYFKYTSELLGLGWNMVFNPVPAALVCLSLLCCNAVPIFCGIYRVIFLFIGYLCYYDTCTLYRYKCCTVPVYLYSVIVLKSRAMVASPTPPQKGSAKC